MDLWCSVLTSTGSVGLPVNVSELNTEFDEITPSFHAESQTLYFSSDRLEGLGGFDVFSAKRSNGTHEEAQNIGLPINSSYHDTYYWTNEGGTKGYFASNRPASKKLDPKTGACCYDLYTFDFMEVGLLARIFDGKTERLLTDATLRVAEIKPDGTLEPLFEREGGSEDGSFRVPLERGKTYQLLASRVDFLPRTDTIRLTGETNRVSKELYLPPEKLDLIVTTFSDEDKEPLVGVTERYFIDGQEISMVRNLDDNRFEHILDRDKTYTLILSKPGYHTDTLVFDRLNPMDPPYVLDKRIFLREKDITEFPPLTLYFDNAQPRPAEADVAYRNIYDIYYARKQDFLREYAAVMNDKNNNAERNRRIMELFFEREIRDSYEELVFLTDKIIEEMERGTRVRLTIKGYTSPLGNAEYNQRLSERRIQTLRNHFDRYQGGVLRTFLQNSQLEIINEPYGESQASSVISDLLDDEGESVYGIGASRERRVEIIGVERLENN